MDQTPLQGLLQTIESKGRLALDVLARKHDAEEASKTNRDRLRQGFAITCAGVRLSRVTRIFVTATQGTPGKPKLTAHRRI